MSARWLRNLISRPTSAPRKFPATGFRNLDGVEKLEEENWDWYSCDTFYSAKIGEIFQSRYQAIGKLGYGAHSTAWLCRDLQYVVFPPLGTTALMLRVNHSSHRYITLKICESDSTSSDREIAAYEHLKNLTTANPGALFIRRLYDSFKIRGAGGRDHLCLVHEPLGFSIETLRQLMPAKQLPEDLLKAVLRHLLQALDCLHQDAKMVHTGQSVNIPLKPARMPFSNNEKICKRATFTFE